MATKIVESAQANVFGQKIPKNKNAMCTITTDPIAPWFIAAEELGEFIGIRFGRVPPEGTPPAPPAANQTSVPAFVAFAAARPAQTPQAAAAGKMGRAGWAGHDQHQHAVAARGGLAHLRGN